MTLWVFYLFEFIYRKRIINFSFRVTLQPRIGYWSCALFVVFVLHKRNIVKL